MRTLILVMLCLVAAALLAFQPATRQPSPAPQPQPQPTLIFYSHFAPGMKGPGVETFHGLTLAVWSDGTVICPFDRRKPGNDLHAGRIKPEQAARLQADLKDAGFFEQLKGGGCVPDGDCTTIAAWHDGKVTRYQNWWTDPDHPALNADASDDTRRFAFMWSRARTAAALARPTTLKPLADDKDATRLYNKARAAVLLP